MKNYQQIISEALRNVPNYDHNIYEVTLCHHFAVRLRIQESLPVI